MSEARNKVISYLKANKEKVSSKEVTIGIDAFIDKIMRVVHSKSEKNEYVFF